MRSPTSRSARNRAPLIVAVALAVVTAGCGLLDGASPTLGPEPATTPRNPEVLDAGAVPRRELRLLLTEGEATTVQLATETAITQQSGTITQTFEPPAVEQTVDQTVSYEITDLTDDEVTYTAAIGQTGTSQVVETPGVPPETAARLLSSRVSGTAVGTIDLRAVTTSVTSSLSGTQVIEGDGAARRTQQIEMTVTVRPVTEP